MLSRTSQRYGRVAMILHWLIALLIALSFAAVWVSETMPPARADADHEQS
jgi:Cytochrome B561